MRTRRRTFMATGLVAILTIAGVTAAIANDPPPRIAFLANGIVPADALAAGPIAGQLGAPIFTTAPDTLPTSTANALDDYNPQLVIVMGGPVAISDGVVAQVSAATGLSVASPNPPPPSGIVRAAGQDRFETAAAAAALLAAYDPAYLPTDMKAIDSDKLDGKDSSAFQPAGSYLGTNQQAADSNLLDGLDSLDVQFPTVVPAGITLVGRYGFDVHTDGDGDWGGQIAYPVPMPASLTPRFVDAGSTPPAQCPGTADDPQASPGNLCVYETTFFGGGGSTMNFNGNSRFGVTYYFADDAVASDMFGHGTWAATAPQPGGGSASPTPAEK